MTDERKPAPSLREQRYFVEGCPMCGSTNIRIGKVPNYMPSRFWGECLTCGLQTKIYRSETETLTAWNRRAPSPGQAAAFRAGLEATARVCQQKQVAGALGDEWDNAYNLAIEHCVEAISAIPTPPEYAAPERKWVRAEDWRGEPSSRVQLWTWNPQMRYPLPYPASLLLNADGRIGWQTSDTFVTPVLPGDLPEPPKDAGE